MNNAVESRPERSLVGRILAPAIAAAMVLLGAVVPTQAASAATVVTTPQEIHDAFQTGGDVVLGGDIDVDARAGHPAVEVFSGSSVTLDLNGFILRTTAEGGAAGIEVPGGAELTIVDAGDGRLEATSVGYGAGIGGNAAGPTGSITIVSGTIVANGGTDGAGLGSGQAAVIGGHVTIDGGTVTATGGIGAAGIGGGASPTRASS
ncbi:MAG: hypothetical protein ACTIL0_06095 [Microbacterium gubbeenense]